MQDMPDKQYESEAHEQAEYERMAKLNALGAALSVKKREAVEFRLQSGVEDIWNEDQAYYDGEEEPSGDKYIKGRTPDESPRMRQKVASGKSTVFVNITQPYVDMYASRVADMLQPNDDRFYALKPTPIPDLDEYADSTEEYQGPTGQIVTAAEAVKAIREKATEISKRSEDRIWDWLTEAQIHREIRKVIHDDARIGVGILKGPIPERRKYKRITRGENGETVIVMEAELVPVSKRVKADNLFPDPACGDNIHDGSYLFERDFLTRRQLGALKGGDYLDEQIDECLKEGPAGAEDAKDEREKKVYEVWYYYGDLSQEEMITAGCECDGDDVPAIITLVNDRVIKAAMSPLDSGEFPFDVLCTRQKDGQWCGTGIGRQIRVPQKMLNAATRTMLNNGGLSAAPIWFMRTDGIRPADGTNDYTLTPGKGFLVDASADGRTVRDSIHFEFIPNLQPMYQAVIQYALELAERLTNMPLMMQGQQGTATETVGGMQILQSNSNSVMRYAAKQFDDQITEPHIGRYYEWLLIHGDVEEEKGDAQIDARGSSALFERDAQNQSILQMAAIVKDPDFAIDPKKWVIEALKAQKLDPARFQYSDEELQEMEQQQGQQQDPRVAGQLQVAQIRTDGELQKATMNQQSDMAELQFKAEEAEKQRQHDREMKQLEYEIAKMQLLDKGKIDITRDTMKLGVQKELSEKATTKSVEVQKPPTEPSQHAPDGESYQQ